MCLIILNTKGIIPIEEFKEAWRVNAHGGGLAWVDEVDGKIKAWRTLKNATALHNKYVEMRAVNPESLFLVHFRLATHGAKTIENTHPFKIHKDLYFAHNGILSNYGTFGLDECSVSDTRDFNERIFKRLPNDFHLDNKICKMVEDHAGAGNKFVLIDSDNNYRIINEKAGHWCHRKENWYSNYSYRRYVPTTPTTYKGGAKVVTGFKGSNTKKYVSDNPPGNSGDYFLPETTASKNVVIKVEFDNVSMLNKDSGEFEAKIKYPSWADKYIGAVEDKEIQFATIDCGLEGGIDIYNKLVWVLEDDKGGTPVLYSRNEIQGWMEASNSNTI
jgi:predicted glutamine amidotransferase